MTETAGTGYLAWNDALAARFFCPEMAGRPVYLFVTEDVVRDVGRTIGHGYEDYLASIRAGPPGLAQWGHCQRALHLAAGWRERHLKYPPYIAYLCLFVVAGGLEGDFDPRSYYPKVWELLGEPQEGTPPSFGKMLDLWDDLEKWSVRDMDGSLGLFEAQIAGGKIYIGLPLAQTVLTEEERQALPGIFADAGLEPASLPTELQLRRALIVYGRSVLRRRTVQVLEKDTGSFISTLLEVVADDFSQWDGEVPIESGRDSLTRIVRGGLRLCLFLDRVSRTVRSNLRCHSGKALPDGGLELSSSSAYGSLRCEEFVPGWSNPLLRESGEELRPPDPWWSVGVTLSDTANGWTVKLPPSPVRLFVEGIDEQLPGLVEVLQLPAHRSFYIAFQDNRGEALESWLTEDCDGWQPFDNLSGLPSGWTMGTIRHARSDRGPRSIDDRLGFPDRRTIRLVGGIPGAVRNTFFSFGRPSALIDGTVAGDTVVCNGKRLEESEPDSGHYDLPDSLPVDERITVEIRNAGENIKRRSLYLVSGVPWQMTRPQVVLDRYGQALLNTDDGIAGAHVPDQVRDPLPQDLLRTPGLKVGAARVYFVGRNPDEVAQWPAEPLPDWAPVWAITLGRRGSAHYCGGALDAALPSGGQVSGRGGGDRWHALLWRERKRIAPPHDAAVNALWRKYVQAARNA